MSGGEPTTFDAVACLLPDALLLVDGGGKVLDANPAARRTLGRDREALLGRSLFDLATTARESVAALLRSASGSRSPIPGLLEFPVGGEGVPYIAEGAVLRPASGDSRATLLLRLRPRAASTARFGMLSDKVGELEREVASRARAEAVLKDQRDLLALVARDTALPETLRELVRVTERYSPGSPRASVLLLDETGRRLRDGAGDRLPPAYRASIDGVEIGPTVGSCGTAAYRNEPVVVADIACDPLWAAFKDLALEHGLRACWSTPIPGQDGGVLGTFAVYYDAPRSPEPGDRQVVDMMTRIAAIAIERDRTDARVRELLELEREARADAEEANRSKDEFLAVVSHELRNPLNAILGWTRLLESPGLDEAARDKGLATIARNVELQSRLIDDMLDYSRITSGRLTLEREPASLPEVVSKACDSVRAEAEARGLALEASIDLPPEPVSVDANRLQQAVSNVLWNAIKFTPKGGRITVCAEGREGLALIRVTDTGCGMDPDFVPFAFDRFRQADAGRARQHGGLGLGLAIVRNLVELHGGTVEAQSDGPGQGSTFLLTLPVEQSATAGRAEHGRPGAGELSGVSILVVEDLADARDLLELTLVRCGARVRTADSAEVALTRLRDECPDVLVCDIGLPGTDGYELLRTWRSADEGERLPALALTAYGSEADRRRAVDAGFDRHMTKPFEPQELVDAVTSLLRASAPATRCAE